jgi:hypothetical protein
MTKNNKPEPDEPLTLAVSVARASKILPLGKTKIYELIKRGVLESELVDGRRIITLRSLKKLAGVT